MRLAFHAAGDVTARRYPDYTRRSPTCSPGILSDLGLTAQQIAAVDGGRPVAKVLSWGDPSEMYVFGAVHVKGSPEAYLRPRVTSND